MNKPNFENSIWCKNTFIKIEGYTNNTNDGFTLFTIEPDRLIWNREGLILISNYYDRVTILKSIKEKINNMIDKEIQKNRKDGSLIWTPTQN